MSKKVKNLSISYRNMRDWLACPECQSREARVEKGSLQLFCPNCKTRQDLKTEAEKTVDALKSIGDGEGKTVDELKDKFLDDGEE